MTKRQSRQREAAVAAAVAAVAVLDPKAKGNDLARRVLGPAEAERIRTADERELVARRKGRTIYRLRRQLYPWAAAAGVLAVGAVLWGVQAATDATTSAAAAVLAAAGGTVVAFVASRGAGRWRIRLRLAALVAACWLLIVGLTGLSLDLMLTLVMSTVGLSLAWWRQVRIPYPAGYTKPEPEPQRADEGPIHVRWNRYIADKGGPLPGSNLTDRDTKHANRESYDGHLVPGRQTLSTVLLNLDKISSGLNVPIRDLLAEEHWTGLPTLFRLTVVTKSPIAETVVYDGPRVVDGVIHIGPYGDGEGYAPWRLWTPGEKPNSGSAWGGYIVGGVGIGKSRLMELLAIGAMSTGCVTVMFCDPQDGASSPDLRDAANWYTGLAGAGRLLTALERIAEFRGKEMAAEGWSGFDPRPDRPLILVFIDESHEVFAQDTGGWETLVRKIRKLGIGIVALSQYPGLKSFGDSEPLRAAIMAGNTIVMRSESKQNGQLVAGLEMDPLTLPQIPGFGYVVKRGKDFARTAPFRAEYVADPSQWMRRFPSVDLDALAANAAGAVYLNRHEEMRAAQEANRREVEAMRTGRPLAAAPAVAVPSKPASGVLVVPAFPAAPAAAGPAERRTEPPATGRELIRQTLAKGQARPAALQQCTGLSEARVRQLLGDMIKGGDVEKIGHGVYRLSDR